MKKLILLHGAIGSKEQLLPLAAVLSKNFEVYSINFKGHGNEEKTEEPFTIEAFSKQLADYIQLISPSTPVNVFGYSMGGYVALYAAKQFPQFINRIVTLGTKFFWDSAVAEQEKAMLHAEKIEEKLPAFANTLQQRHVANGWKNVLAKTTDMLEHLGESNLLLNVNVSTIPNPTLLMLGDRDKMVTIHETINVYAQLPNAQMCILPGVPHLLEKADINLLTYMIERFIKS